MPIAGLKVFNSLLPAFPIRRPLSSPRRLAVAANRSHRHFPSSLCGAPAWPRLLPSSPSHVAVLRRCFCFLRWLFSLIYTLSHDPNELVAHRPFPIVFTWPVARVGAAFAAAVSVWVDLRRRMSRSYRVWRNVPRRGRWKLAVSKRRFALRATASIACARAIWVALVQPAAVKVAVDRGQAAPSCRSVSRSHATLDVRPGSRMTEQFPPRQLVRCVRFDGRNSPVRLEYRS